MTATDDARAGHLVFGGGSQSPRKVAPTLLSAHQRLDPEVEAFVVHARQDPSWTQGVSLPLGSKDRGHALTPPQCGPRRLTTIECERLQGFPDNWTRIPWGKKRVEDCPEGHRYEAIGNSMAVPVMRWIGERIAMVEASHG